MENSRNGVLVSNSAGASDAIDRVRSDWRRFAVWVRWFIIAFSLTMITIGDTTVGQLLAVPLSFGAIIVLFRMCAYGVSYRRALLQERRRSDRS